MLLEELGKRWYGNIERIGAVVLLQSAQIGRTCDAFGPLERFQLGFWVGIYLVREGPERVRFGIVEESALLEEEGQVRLASDLCLVSAFRLRRGMRQAQG